jgi:hypothetical protein
MGDPEGNILGLITVLLGRTEVAFTHSGRSNGEGSADNGSAGAQRRAGNNLAEHCDMIRKRRRY